MIAREFTADRLNAIVNHPAVHQWVAMPGQGALDLSGVVADECNILLMGDGGGILFHQLDHGVYEAHSQFLPEARGPKALATMREAFHWMFIRSNCMEILTQVPSHNRAASVFARRCGGVLDFVRENAWQTENGPVSIEYYGLRYADWIRTASGLVESGEEFHDRLKTSMKAAGYPDMHHPEDKAHDRYVGAAYEMISAGQIAKGMTLYNRWARFTGHDPIVLVAPDILDIGHVFLRPKCSTIELQEVNWREFEVIQCQ